MIGPIFSPASCSLAKIKNDEQNLNEHALEFVFLDVRFRNVVTQEQLPTVVQFTPTDGKKKFHVSRSPCFMSGPKNHTEKYTGKKSRAICFPGYIMTSTNFDDYK
jgi:hypothetical protein